MALYYVNPNYWEFGYAVDDEMSLSAANVTGSSTSSSNTISVTQVLVASANTKSATIPTINIVVTKTLTVSSSTGSKLSPNTIINNKHVLLSDTNTVSRTSSSGTISVSNILIATSNIKGALSSSNSIVVHLTLIAYNCIQSAFSSVDNIEYGPLRIIPVNVAKNSVLTTLNTTLPGFNISNLVDNNKGKVFRNLANTSNIKMSWDVEQGVSCVAIPFSNLTSSATIRIKLYSDSARTVEILDTGVLSFVDRATYFSRYSNIKGMDVTVSDSSLTYIDIASLVCGAAWSPKYNTDFNVVVSQVTTDVHSRSHSGNIITDVGTKNRTMVIPLSWLTETDKLIFLRIMKSNDYMFISIFPIDANPVKRIMYQIYGKASSLSTISYNTYGIYSSSISIEEL